MEHSQTNGARPNIFIQNCKYTDFVFPGWMEQSVCSGANYVNTLYYDRTTYNNIEFTPLIDIINKAIDIIKQGITLKNNLNTDANIFIEYCRRSPNGNKYCKYLTDKALFIENFICEHPLAIETDLVDIDLLHKIKDEFEYQRKYEY